MIFQGTQNHPTIKEKKKRSNKLIILVTQKWKQWVHVGSSSSMILVPEYGKEEEKNKIAKFEEPLLLFPIEQVEYLSYVNQVLSPLIPNWRKKTRNEIVPNELELWQANQATKITHATRQHLDVPSCLWFFFFFLWLHYSVISVKVSKSKHLIFY